MKSLMLCLLLSVLYCSCLTQRVTQTVSLEKPLNDTVPILQGPNKLVIPEGCRLYFEISANSTTDPNNENRELGLITETVMQCSLEGQFTDQHGADISNGRFDQTTPGGKSSRTIEIRTKKGSQNNFIFFDPVRINYTKVGWKEITPVVLQPQDFDEDPQGIYDGFTIEQVGPPGDWLYIRITWLKDKTF